MRLGQLSARVLVGLLLALTAGSVSAQGQQASQPPSPAAQQANTYFTASDWERAAAAYRDLTKAQPQNQQYWFRLGMSLHELGKYNDAIAAFNEFEKLNATFAPTNFRKARAYAKLGKTDEALRLLDASAQAGFGNVQMVDTDHDLDSLRADARFKAFRDRVYRNANPCDTLEHKQFDFWVGEWDAYTSTGNQLAGKSHIDRLISPCALMENWESVRVPYQGKSINIYNSALQKWQQFYVDTSGRVTEYSGAWRDGALRFEATALNANGTPNLLKMTFVPNADGSVRQYGELSTDGGKTWAISFDFKYVKRQTAQGAK